MKTFKLFKRGADARCLDTNDATEAQRRARAKHATITHAVRTGEADRLADTKLRHRAFVTLGELFPIYRQHTRCAPRTAVNNIGSLRLVLRRALAPPALSDSEVGGQSVTILTRKLVLDFQTALLKNAGPDYRAQDRAATTANSLLRQARSLFAGSARNNMMETYHAAGLRLPASLETFRRAPLLPEPEHTFEAPSAELISRLRTAAAALRAADPNGYRIYLLTCGCGLRKKEIAYLCGSHIAHLPAGAHPRHIIELKTRANFRTKNRKPRYVPMEAHVWDELVALDPRLAAPGSAAPATPLTDYLLTGSAHERYNLVKSDDYFSPVVTIRNHQ